MFLERCTPKEQTAFFSSAQGTFPGMDHRLGHKTSLGKLKKTEMIPSVISDHVGMKLGINYKTNKQTNPEKHTNSRRLYHMLLNNEWINNEIKEEIIRYFETNENENMTQNL